MKKLFIISLLFFYLSSVSGMNINVHYCCGKVKYVSFFEVKEKKSCCGNKKKSKRCCHDKTTIVKIADKHQSAYYLKVPGPVFKITDFAVQLTALKIPRHGLPINSTFLFYKPPIPDLSTTYLSNRHLLI